MQDSSLTWAIFSRAGCATGLVFSLAACNDVNAAGGAAAADTARAGTSAVKPGIYVLHAQVRPENPGKHFAIERGVYQACVEIAKAQDFPVKPFPVLPPDFVVERRTYASDGKRVSFREVNYGLDLRSMKPKQGCEVRLESRWHASVISNGEERDAGSDADGNVAIGEPVPNELEPVRPASLASRTVAKRINGVPLKCDAQNDCIVDPEVVLVARGKRPVSVSYRNEGAGTNGTALIVEPVSLTVGKPVDASLFALEKDK